MSPEEKKKHTEQVRNEGLLPHDKSDTQIEIDLEIEDPGAANKVAEEGS